MFLFVHLVGPVSSIVPSSFFEVVPMAITRAKTPYDRAKIAWSLMPILAGTQMHFLVAPVDLWAA